MCPEYNLYVGEGVFQCFSVFLGEWTKGLHAKGKVYRINTEISQSPHPLPGPLPGSISPAGAGDREQPPTLQDSGTNAGLDAQNHPQKSAGSQETQVTALTYLTP